jgi:peptidoglycan/LPS O-acetylase OafA/YrhL
MVIVGAYIRARSPLDFIIDRATRIFPVLWASIFAVFLLIRFSGERMHFSSFGEMMLVLLANLLALPNMLPIPLIHPAAWSLSYEFTFYWLFVLFGVLYRYFGARAGWVVVPLGMCILAGHVRGVFLVAGVLIAIGVFEKPWLVWATRMPLVWIGVFLLAWQTSVALSGREVEDLNIFRMISDGRLMLVMVIGTLAGTFGLAGIFYGRGWLGHLLCRPLFQWLGTISYSLYLWQMPVMAIVKRTMHLSGMVPHLGGFAQPTLFLLALPPTLIISACSQKILEVRVTKWLRRHLKMGNQAPRSA